MENILDEYSSLGVQHVGFGTRVGAYIIDSIILIPIVGVATFLNLLYWKSIVLLILVQLVNISYKIFMEGKFGATLGKMAVKIKVVNSEYKKINMNEAFIRSIPFTIAGILSLLPTLDIFMHPDFQYVTDLNSYVMFFSPGVFEPNLVMTLLSYVGSILVLVSCLWILGNKDKFALHDKWANTICVHTTSLKS